MEPYSMQTQRVGFAHWKREDAPLALSLWGNPAVARFICASGRFTEPEAAQRLALEMSNQEKFGVQYWPMYTLASGAFLGCCGLRPKPGEAGVFELGFHLLPEHWGAGYATEAARAVIAFAFETLGAQNLIAGHHPQNEGSRRVLAKLGFHRVEDVFYPPTGLMHAAYVFRPSQA